MAGVKQEAIRESSMISPYYLSPSDNPGTLITHVFLNGEHYAEWPCAKRKTGFIDGILSVSSLTKKPMEAEQWKTINLSFWNRALQ